MVIQMFAEKDADVSCNIQYIHNSIANFNLFEKFDFANTVMIRKQKDNFAF